MNTYIQNLYKYKDLFIELIIKDIKLKYKNSVLGIIWSMLNPLLMMIVFSIVFMAIFKSDIPNFPVYVLIGRVLYQFFSEATSFAMESIRTNSTLINKVYVPKYFFPLSRVCSSLIVTIISMIPIIVMMLATGMKFHWMNLLFILPLVYLFLVAAGIGLLLSAVCVFFNDIKHLYSIILLILMYLTPIFYPASIIPEQFMPLITFNPLYPIVTIFRDIVMYGSFSDPQSHALAIINVIFYCIVGLFTFYKTQDRFIYHL